MAAPPFPSTRTNTLRNEQLWHMQILNQAYNDNLRHIDHYHNQIQQLRQSNADILRQVQQLLHPADTPPSSPIEPIAVFSFDGTEEEMHNILRRFFTNEEPASSLPSEEQIQRSIQRAVYRDLNHPTATRCPISMEPFQADDSVSIIQHCQHMFRSEALDQWLRHHATCPVCRHNIRTD